MAINGVPLTVMFCFTGCTCESSFNAGLTRVRSSVLFFVGSNVLQ
uniref:Uncharacterized protein n=1 Tax=Anguilla anguilla TaxID=7936 RepID=A0A0E9QAG5_ANGAN